MPLNQNEKFLSYKITIFLSTVSTADSSDLLLCSIASLNSGCIRSKVQNVFKYRVTLCISMQFFPWSMVHSFVCILVSIRC